jgi:ribulose-5-phosphate 4-epimerase/fuculose-1-phosphate aldolase
MMEERCIIGVDAGTSMVKAVAFDSVGNEVCSHEMPVELLRLRPDWVEQDMNSLWQTVKVCLGKVVCELRESKRTLAGIGFTSTGTRLPSSETEIHRALLNKKKYVAAIIHSHSPYATAVSCLHQAVPPFVEDLVQIIGGRVNCAPYVRAGQHKRIAEVVAGAIGEENAVLLANHGVFCCGRTLDEAFVASQILEKAAIMMLAAGSLGKVIPIPDEFVRSERHRFLYKYGTAADAPEVAS